MAQNLAGTITTGSNPARLMPGVRAFWGAEYNAISDIYDKIYDRVSSNKAFEMDAEETGFGLAPMNPEGESIHYDSTKPLADTLTRNITYGLGFTITQEAIEDNQYDALIPKYTRLLARSMKATKEYKAALKFANNDTSADKQPLFSKTHPVIGGSQSNIIETPGTLTAETLGNTITLVSMAKDARGLPILAKPRALVVSSKNAQAAQIALNSFQDPSSGNNAINPVYKILPDGIIVNPYLDGYADDMWFVTTDLPEAFKYYDRRAINLSQENEFDTENLKVKATERYGFAFIDFRGAVAGHL